MVSHGALGAPCVYSVGLPGAPSVYSVEPKVFLVPAVSQGAHGVCAVP